MKLSFVAICFVFWTSPAFARVFVMSEQSFGAYLQGAFGSTSLGDSPITQAFESGLNSDSRYTQMANYGLGFMYAAGPIYFRFGVDVLKPSSLKGVQVSNSSGSVQYTVDNDVIALVPQTGLEFTLYRWGNARFYVGGLYDYGDVTSQNSVTLTNAGKTAHPGLADYREEVTGVTSGWQVSSGFEFWLADATTVAVEGGYRNLEFTSLKHNVSNQTVQGTVAKGDPALQGDGSARSLDLSGYYVGVSLRFWIR